MIELTFENTLASFLIKMIRNRIGRGPRKILINQFGDVKIYFDSLTESETNQLKDILLTINPTLELISKKKVIKYEVWK